LVVYLCCFILKKKHTQTNFTTNATTITKLQARRKELNDARLAKLEREGVVKELRKKVVREANTSGPRIAQQITDAQDARKKAALEKIRRRREELGY